MFPDVTSAVATNSRLDRIARADGAHRAHLARATRPAAPCAPRPAQRRHHLPQVGCRFRHWLAAGYL